MRRNEKLRYARGRYEKRREDTNMHDKRREAQ